MSEEQKQNDVRGQAREWRRGAASLFKWTVLIVVGVPLMWFTFCEARKGYWDWRVTQMCEKDGGQRIFRLVTLPEAEYESMRVGEKIDLQNVSSSKKSDRFAYRSTTTYMRRGSPEVRRYDLQVIRISSEEVLAEQTQFSRVGGDALEIQPSHFSCPKFKTSLYEMTFRVAK